MPHIHTKPGQHDITASAWIFREINSRQKVLVHMHRKLGKLMQTGGHIELNETPWQTISHELTEEAGYKLSQLSILQPIATVPTIAGATVHPVPVLSNTHKVSEGHYHSDFCYAFIADSEPHSLPVEGESEDLRWLTIEELYEAATLGEALQDVAEIYDYIASSIVPKFHKIKASHFSVEKPSSSLISSK